MPCQAQFCWKNTEGNYLGFPADAYLLFVWNYNFVGSNPIYSVVRMKFYCSELITFLDHGEDLLTILNSLNILGSIGLANVLRLNELFGTITAK